MMHKIKFVTNYILLNQFGGAKKKWITLEHSGPMFPLPYEKHNVPVIYQGQEIVLDETSEEIATMYAKLIESDYVKNRTFNKNFWHDWRNVLGKDHTIQNLNDVDFKPIYNYLLNKKIEKKINPINKEEKTAVEEIYKWAYIDGRKEAVGNFRIEPPSIYLGRGCNPKSGMVKRRIYPEDITINISKNVSIPLLPKYLQNHHWGHIIHDQTVEWLCSWRDDITGKTKYVWLGQQSEFKATSDMEKFDLARKLGKKIKKVRTENNNNMHSSDPKIRQIATALYFIDNFALRVGNEKKEDEADTVGVTSLRVEHIKLLDNDQVKLDFLGKDSVPYNRTLQVEPVVYQNLVEYIGNKNPDENLFNLINSADVNKYLQSFMKNLTAKVFRTYNASNVFQKELKKINAKFDSYDKEDKINLLLDEFNKANAKVAMLCNHQKNITKSTNKQIENLDNMIKNAKNKLRAAKKSKKKNPEKIAKMEDTLKKLKAKKILKIELKNISLGTSLLNYIDPRSVIAFLKRHNIPAEKIFSKTVSNKFQWAMDTDPNYVF